MNKRQTKIFWLPSLRGLRSRTKQPSRSNALTGLLRRSAPRNDGGGGQIGQRLTSTHFAGLTTPTGLNIKVQGCAYPRYPGIWRNKNVNPNGVEHYYVVFPMFNPVGVDNLFASLPRVARIRATLGFDMQPPWGCIRHPRNDSATTGLLPRSAPLNDGGGGQIGQRPTSTHFAGLTTPTGLNIKAQGCAYPRYPGIWRNKNVNPNGVAHYYVMFPMFNPVGVDNLFASLPRVARIRATLGFDVQPPWGCRWQKPITLVRRATPYV